MTSPRDDTDFPLPEPDPEASFEDFIGGEPARPTSEPPAPPGEPESASPQTDPYEEVDPFEDAGPEPNPFDLCGSSADALPPADPFGDPGPGADAGGAETYTLGETTVPPKWGADRTPSRPEPPVTRPRRPKPAATPAAPADAEDSDDDDAEVAPRAGRSAGPAKPKIRDWIEARCKKEAKMYALGAAVLGPVGLAAVGITWGVAWLISPFDGLLAWVFATVVVAALFWLNKQAGDARTIRVHVDPKDREIEPVTLDVPRGSGLTWLMYLTGSRDLPGFVQFIGTVTLFGPRLCDLAVQMGRTAQQLWTIDVDAIANPLKTLVRAGGRSRSRRSSPRTPSCRRRGWWTV